MILKVLLIIYIILTLAFIVMSEFKQSKTLSVLESKFEGIEFVYEGN